MHYGKITKESAFQLVMRSAVTSIPTGGREGQVVVDVLVGENGS